jgi:hypothetical protein
MISTTEKRLKQMRSMQSPELMHGVCTIRLSGELQVFYPSKAFDHLRNLFESNRPGNLLDFGSTLQHSFYVESITIPFDSFDRGYSTMSIPILLVKEKRSESWVYKR